MLPVDYQQGSEVRMAEKPQPGIKSFLADAQGPAESYQDTSTRVLSKSLTQVSACKRDQGTTWSKRSSWRMCPSAEEKAGAAATPTAGSGVGGFHTGCDAQGRFFSIRKFNTRSFSFCSSLAAAGASSVFPSCHRLRPPTFSRSQPSGNLSAA